MRSSEHDKNEFAARLQALSRDGDKWSEEVTVLRRQVGEYEDKLRRMVQENERLTGLLQRAGNENQ